MESQNFEHSTLPQYGFGADVDFDSLIRDNHFLFRVYTPKPLSPFFDDSDPYFIAPKFNERYNISPEQLTELRAYNAGPVNQIHIGTYGDAVRHMDWTTRSSSPYISTSFSFIWSIWEALRRYHAGVKKDVEIAIISASAVSGRSITAVELLRKSSPSERRNEYWKWYRYSQESQSVLVYESIPRTAVFASVPLLSLLEKLPSYFLRPDVPRSLKTGPLAAVAWDYTERKRSYRQFCQDMGSRFLQLSHEARLQDATTGSVRLAMSFLRPWFHQQVVDDFQSVTVTLCSLAFSIAQWPGQWWVQEHSEMWSLIQAISLSLAEEVREKQNGRASTEVSSLQATIADLKISVEKYRKELSSRESKKPAHMLAPLLIPPPLKPITTSPSPLILAPSYGLPQALSRSALSAPTPITPPTSPIRSTTVTFPIEDPVIPEVEPTPTSLVTSLSKSSPSPPKCPELSPINTASDLEVLHAECSTPVGKTLPPSPVSETVQVSPVDIPLPAELESELLVEPPSPVEEATTQFPHDLLVPYHLYASNSKPPSPFMLIPPPTVRGRARRPPSAVETASCIVTGFLIGAFITLSLLSPQRRTLLTHLT